MINSTIGEPLGGLLEQYRAELERLNYSRWTIYAHLRSIRRLSGLIIERNVPLDELTPDIAADLVLRADCRGDRQQYVVFIVRRFVGYLAMLGVAKSPAPPMVKYLKHAVLRRDYENYLRRQRGLSERTIGHCWRFADRFLDFRFAKADVEMGAIIPGDIVAFLQHLTARKAAFRDKTPSTHLRNFFQYLFESGLTATNLALCVPNVAQRWGARLPRHLSPERVEAVLAAVRADLGIGRATMRCCCSWPGSACARPRSSRSSSTTSTGVRANLLVRGKGKNCTTACRSRRGRRSAEPTIFARNVGHDMPHDVRHGTVRRIVRSRTARSSTPSSRRP